MLPLFNLAWALAHLPGSIMLQMTFCCFSTIQILSYYTLLINQICAATVQIQFINFFVVSILYPLCQMFKSVYPVSIPKHSIFFSILRNFPFLPRVTKDHTQHQARFQTGYQMYLNCVLIIVTIEQFSRIIRKILCLILSYQQKCSM